MLVAPPRERRGRARGRRRDDGRHRRAALAARRPRVDELAAGPRAGRRTSLDPVDAVQLDPAGLADVAAAVAVRDDLAGAVVGDADAALRAYDAAIARTDVRRPGATDPEGFRAAAAGLRAAHGPAARPGDPARPGRRHLQPGLRATRRWC